MLDLPVTLLDDMDRIPRDRPVSLLMRHSARFPITDLALTYTIGLTEEGIQMAEALGERLSVSFLPGRMLTAPVGRCLATAEAIARGAGWQAEIGQDDRLSHPFMAPAWSMLEHGKLNGVLPFQVQVTLKFLLDHRPNPSLQGQPLLDILVTHDTVVGAMVGCLLGAPVLDADWPGYLEGMFVWQEDDKVLARWRGSEMILPKEFARIG